MARDSVNGFSFLMEQRLVEKNAENPNGWKYSEPRELFTSLDMKAEDLYVALEQDDGDKAISAAIDVANYAMMIADLHGGFGEVIGQ